jgi:hypothetical protein
LIPVTVAPDWYRSRQHNRFIDINVVIKEGFFF